MLTVNLSQYKPAQGQETVGHCLQSQASLLPTRASLNRLSHSQSGVEKMGLTLSQVWTRWVSLSVKFATYSAAHLVNQARFTTNSASSPWIQPTLSRLMESWSWQRRQGGSTRRERRKTSRCSTPGLVVVTGSLACMSNAAQTHDSLSCSHMAMGRTLGQIVISSLVSVGV